MKAPKSIIIAVICAFTLCAGCAHKSATLPRASTAAVSNNINQLNDSIGKVRQNVSDVKGKLSEIDAKAVRIQESIRNW